MTEFKRNDLVRLPGGKRGQVLDRYRKYGQWMLRLYTWEAYAREVPEDSVTPWQGV